MVYKDNPEGAYSRVNGNNDNTYHDNDDDVEEKSTPLEISHPMNSISDNNTKQTRNYKEICMMTCFICGMMIFGYIAGFKLGGTDSLPLLNTLDFSGHTTDDDDSTSHMRASAASMTEATAKDIAANKVIDNSNRFDDMPDLSKVDKKLLKFLTRSSYAREKTMQLLTDEFISDQSTDTSISDKVVDTIEAMELVVSDGLPVQVEGFPFLFVGSVGAVMNEKALKEYGITDIISWSTTAKCNNYPFIKYMCFTNVSNYGDMKKHMDDELNAAVDRIEEVRKAGGKVMSQCWYGRNRSVTLLVAYLLKYGGFDYDAGEEALQWIQKTRPIADSYRGVINSYGKKYGGYAGGKKRESKGSKEKAH